MNRIQLTAFLVSAGALALPACLQAGNISLVDIFKNDVYTQTSGAAPTTPSNFFANVELDSVGPDDFDNVTAGYTGSASPTISYPIDLPMVDPTFFGYGQNFGSQADMDAAVPVGMYNYTATNSSTMDTEMATLNYTQDAFASAIPALSAATFSALNGLNPDTALSVDFDSFTQNPAADAAYTFFTISDSTGTVFTDGFLDPSTTSLLLPANTLMADTTYNFELDFSDRQDGTDPATGVPTLIGSDVRTDGSFTTGSTAPSVPEPGTLLLFGSGILAVSFLRRLRA